MVETNNQNMAGTPAFLSSIPLEDRKYMAAILKKDPQAALGAELVGPRAFGEHNYGDLDKIPFFKESPGTLGAVIKSEGILDALNYHKEFLPFIRAARKRNPSLPTVRDPETGVTRPYIFYRSDSQTRRDPASVQDFQERPLSPEEKQSSRIAVAVHELRHIADFYLSNQMGMDETSEDFGENPWLTLTDRHWFKRHGIPRLISIRGAGGRRRPVQRAEQFSEIMDIQTKRRLKKMGATLPPLTHPERELGPRYQIPHRFTDRYTARDPDIPDLGKSKAGLPRYSNYDYLKALHRRKNYHLERRQQQAQVHPQNIAALHELNRLQGRPPLQGAEEYLREFGVEPRFPAASKKSSNGGILSLIQNLIN